MKSLHRLLPLVAICLLTLSACKPAANKVASSAPAQASQSAVTSPAAANALQLAPSGQYLILATPQAGEQSGKVEVIEFFAYFCSHCKSFDPLLVEWANKNASKVTFKRIPVAFRDDATAQQRMYFALEAMGKLDDLHEKLFHAVQVERRALNSESDILDFLDKNGVDKKKFKEVFDSFGIQSKVQQAAQLQAVYQINSVPNIAVGGRYLTSVAHAQKRPGVKETEEGLQIAATQILDELVATTIKDHQGVK